MNPALPFIKKQHADLPDFYGIKVIYLNGEVREFQGTHYPMIDKGVIEILTKDDTWHFIPMSAILTIDFDKQFSHVVAIRQQMIKDKQKNDSKPAAI